MSDFKREKHNPIELMKMWWPDADLSHITYDPKMKASDREYWRIEESGGDGTLSFTIEMLQKALLPIINMCSTCKRTEPKDWRLVKGMKYTIGDMRHATVYGKVELRCGGKYHGQLERVRFPVRVEYIL